MVSKEVLDLICCIKCNGNLKEIRLEEKDFLECLNCSKKYLVKDDIPILLEDHNYS